MLFWSGRETASRAIPAWSVKTFPAAGAMDWLSTLCFIDIGTTIIVICGVIYSVPDWLMNWLMDRLIDCFFVRLIDRSSDWWLIDWLIDWLNGQNYFSFYFFLLKFIGDANLIFFCFRPHLIDFRAARQRTNRENLEIAFGIAEKEFGVTRLLDAEGRPGQLCNALRDKYSVFGCRKKCVYL